MHMYILICDGGSNSLDGEGDCEHSKDVLSSNESNYKARMIDCKLWMQMLIAHDCCLVNFHSHKTIT